jgi:translation elongation factor EF-Tu-like GTPase
LLVTSGDFFGMKKVHVNVGTIGHIDHGKTIFAVTSFQPRLSAIGPAP